MEKSEAQKQNQKDEVIIIEEKISKVNGDYHKKQYQKGKLLGRGGFAKCYEVTNLETRQLLAAKIIPKSSLTKTRARSKLISQIKIHKALHNRNVVQFENVFEDQENVYILLELCQNQTLNELIKRRRRLHELECMCYVMQIINALKYLHNNRVIHRDLKLGNLFLGDYLEIKLGDFGLATKLEFDGEKKRTICGTPNYIAPEILDDKSGHSYPVDIWSLGVIIYTMLIGKPPFETPDVKTTYKKIRMNNYQFPDHLKIGDNARNLIVSILQSDPERRPKIDDIIKHPFLNQCQIPKNLPLSSIACPLSNSYIQAFQNTQTQKVEIKKNNQLDYDSSFKKGKDKKMESGPMTLSQTGFRNTQPIKNTQANTQQGMNTVHSVGGFNSQIDMLNKPIKPANQEQTIVNQDDQEVWVVTWVDYSCKYGLGYLLSNGCCGVYFNDASKIILDENNTFDYLQKVNSEKQDQCSTFTMNDYPKEVQKKVTLLQHFKTYLNGENKIEFKKSGDQVPSNNQSRPLIYIKKWMKTKHAIMFRLSNKMVQVNFTDKTEIQLSSQKRRVIYVNKKGERSTYPLSTAMESDNPDMAKRLKYTKEILTHMITNNHRAQGQDGDKERNPQSPQQ